MKLADGKKLTSSSYTECLVSFGVIQTVLRFELLSCDVQPILGFTFLKQVNPQIDWKHKEITVYKGKHKYHLKTIDPAHRDKYAFVALPNSKSRIEACGGVRVCALLAILALTCGLELDDVDCPTCGLPHVD